MAFDKERPNFPIICVQEMQIQAAIFNVTFLSAVVNEAKEGKTLYFWPQWGETQEGTGDFKPKCCVQEMVLLMTQNCAQYPDDFLDVLELVFHSEAIFLKGTVTDTRGRRLGSITPIAHWTLQVLP